jgi:hypothetical protein
MRVKAMNPHMMEILAREVIQSLPPDQKAIYKYVVQLEDELAQQVTTSDEFMALLVKHSPHRQAAKHFNMTFGQILMTMHRIEDTISEQLEKKTKNAIWIDVTEKVNAQNKNEKVKYFYFSFDKIHS